MRKGITLQAKVYIEGDDEPANDFSKVAQDLLAKVLDAGIKSTAGPYKIVVQKMEALEGSDDSDEG
ncbi:MAG: hypothetical protein ACXWQR_17245 [Ktedonobacterales bacterium]